MNDSRARRFAVIAATVYGNRGAEAMLETTIGRLRDLAPGSTFAVYSYYPAEDRRLVSDPDVAIHSSTPAYLVGVLFPLSLLLAIVRWIPGAHRAFPASVSDLCRADALVDLAGVSFIDGREKYLPFNVFTILPAMLLGTPVFKLSQAMGPFQGALNRFASRLLHRCALVVPRGETTVTYLREAAFPEARMLPAPDTAFAFEMRDALSDEGADEVGELIAAMGRLADAGIDVVGICPSSVIASKALAQGWDYPCFLADVVLSLLHSGRAVLLFPNATREAAGDSARNNDLPVIGQVIERVRSSAGDAAQERLLAVRGDVAAAGLRGLVERCTCVAVSRFHAMIAALSTAVPVMVLGWSHKYAEVMADFGLEEYVLDYSEHDAQAFYERLEALCSDAEAIADLIGARARAVAAASAAQFVEVIERLDEADPS